MSTYFKLGSMVEGIQSTATSGGTLNLTASSRVIQQLTGTQAHTVVLPDATTLSAGRRFDINNRSTQSIVVQDFSGSTLATITTNSQQYFLVTNISTAAGSWSVGGNAGGGGTGVVSTSDSLNLLGGLAGLSFKTDNIISVPINVTPEEVGGNYWTTVASLPSARSWPFGGALNGFMYTAGGTTNSGDTNETVRYDDDNNYHLVRANLNSARTYGGSLETPTAFYVVGGTSLTTIEKYSDTLNTWTSTNNLLGVRNGTSCFYVGGFGYLAGGTDTIVTIEKIEAYDETANTWKLRNATTYSLNNGAASFGINDFGYMIGGSDAGVNTYTAGGSQYDHSANSWRSTGSLSVARGQMSGSAIGDFGYVTAGFTNASNYDLNEEFISSSNYFRTRATIPTYVRYGTSSVNLNGQLYIAGARRTNAPDRLDLVERYRNSSFVSLGTIKRSTTVPTSVLVSILANALIKNTTVQIRTDGDNWKTFEANRDSFLKNGQTISKIYQTPYKVYALGGQDGAVTTTLTNNQYYDPIANTWSARAALPTANSRAGAFSLHGYGYLFGGLSDLTTPTNAVRTYNDITNSFISKGNLPFNRVVPSSISLDGFGYSVSGSTTVNVADRVATVNKYDPNLDSWSSVASVNTARYLSGCGAFNGGTLLTFGGTNGSVLSSSELYNNTSNTWISRANMNTAVVRMAYGNLGNKIISVNGDDGGSANVPLQEYDAATNAWTNRANIGVADTYNNQGTSYGQSEFYSYGGNPSPFNQNYRWTKETHTWVSRTLVTTPFIGAATRVGNAYYNYEVRVGASALYAGLGGKIWVNGVAAPVSLQEAGTDLGGNGVMVNNANAYHYNVATTSWMRLPLLSGFSTGGQGSFSLYDQAYFLGGADGNNNSISNCAKLSDITFTYTTITSLNTGSGRPGRGTLNGYGYIASGASGGGHTSVNQRYNVATNSWTNLATVYAAEAPRSFVSQGFFHLTGGYIGSFLNNHSQYNDSSNAWTTKANGDSIYGVAGAEFEGKGLVTGGLTSPSHSSTTAVKSYNLDLNLFITEPSLNSVKASQGIFNLEGKYHTHSGSSFEILTPSIKNAVLGCALEIK